MKSLSHTLLGMTLMLVLSLTANSVHANRYDVRQEIREGRREVAREKYEAYRELKRCNTKACARREVREGYREVNRERREARYEVRRELRQSHREDYWDRREERRDDRRKFLGAVVAGAAVAGVLKSINDDDD